MELRVLTAEEVRQALPMAAAIDAVKQAYRQLSAEQAEVPLRSHIQAEADTVALFMPAYLRTSKDLAVKIVSVAPSNPARGLPTIHALVVVLDPETGVPLAALEGASLTAIRTGAASGAATDVMAREDAHSVAIFGSGVQARTQLEAVCTVRAIKRVSVYSLDREEAVAFAQEMAGRGPIPTAISLAEDPRQAVSEADIICTATTSSTPVFDGRDVRPGTHINAIGSFTPEMQEVDSETIKRALIVVDSREAALAEAGDLIIPIEQGEITAEAIHAELGEILNGDKPGRSGEDQITYFKSVGVAVQDAAAARRALEGAMAHGLGQRIEL